MRESARTPRVFDDAVAFDEKGTANIQLRVLNILADVTNRDRRAVTLVIPVNVLNWNHTK
jgi:hypothetical protein